MLTIKLMKYGPEGRATTPASFVQAIAMHSAKDVYLDYEKDGRAVLRFNDMEVTVGDTGDVSYDVAYILNEAGKTVDTIR